LVEGKEDDAQMDDCAAKGDKEDEDGMTDMVILCFLSRAADDDEEEEGGGDDDDDDVGEEVGLDGSTGSTNSRSDGDDEDNCDEGGDEGDEGDEGDDDGDKGAWLSWNWNIPLAILTPSATDKLYALDALGELEGDCSTIEGIVSVPSSSCMLMTVIIGVIAESSLV
jgi:hypothetical protein